VSERLKGLQRMGWWVGNVALGGIQVAETPKSTKLDA